MSLTLQKPVRTPSLVENLLELDQAVLDAIHETLLAICISEAIIEAGHEVVCCVPSDQRSRLQRIIPRAAVEC
jgi:hypothetical protein